MTYRYSISDTLEHEKLEIIQRNMEKIELGLNEAQVMISLHTHVNTIEAEKQKLRAQVYLHTNIHNTHINNKHAYIIVHTVIIIY